jgi:hypothetical protein
MIISYQPTTDFLGTCKPCNRPLRWSNPDRPEKFKTDTATCAGCGAKLKGQRVYATQSQRACDISCQFAKSDKCACSCRGKNHGNMFNPIVAGETLAANLGLYRQRYAKRSEAAKKAAATRAAAKQAALAQAAKAVTAFQAEHRALVVWMATEGTGWLVNQTLRDMDKHLAVPSAERLAELYEAKAAADRHDADHAEWMAANAAMVAWMGEQDGDFLRSMSEAVQEGHLLTERQEAAVRRIYEEHLATKDIPALAAGRQQLTGTVEAIEEEWQGGPYGNGHNVQKMQLRTPQGQLVQVSVTGPMYDVLGSNWEHLEADLVGKQVTVKATVKASYRKPWCGWGSRPHGFALVA